MTSETDYPVDESAMSTSTPVLDRVSARLGRLSVRADDVRQRLTRGVTLTERVEPESGDLEDLSFLRRPALLGLLAVISICVGASLPSSPFKLEAGGHVVLRRGRAGRRPRSCCPASSPSTAA